MKYAKTRVKESNIQNSYNLKINEKIIPKFLYFILFYFFKFFFIFFDNVI